MNHRSFSVGYQQYVAKQYATARYGALSQVFKIVTVMRTRSHNQNEAYASRTRMYRITGYGLEIRTATRSCRRPGNAYFTSIRQVSSDAARLRQWPIYRPILYDRDPCGHCCMPRHCCCCAAYTAALGNMLIKINNINNQL